MNRREFLGQALAVPMAGAAIVAAACGGDDGGAATVDARPRDCLANGTQVSISGDHAHDMQVPVADIQAGSPVTYTLGGADHTHTCMVTTAQFGQLASNQSVMTRSSFDAGHSHPITIGCA